MNYNLIGTLSAIVTVLSQLFVNVVGCVEATATCSASWLTPTWAGYVSAAFAAFLFVTKLFRSGGPLAGLFFKSAVIVAPADAKVGVVTPQQVAAPGPAKTP